MARAPDVSIPTAPKPPVKNVPVELISLDTAELKFHPKQPAGLTRHDITHITEAQQKVIFRIGRAISDGKYVIVRGYKWPQEVTWDSSSIQPMKGHASQLIQYQGSFLMLFSL